MLVVNDQQPYKTLKELVDDAKNGPNEIVYSSSGLYGALHLPTALFMKAAGVQMRHLPTAGGGPALTAMLGNNAQVLASSIAAANAQIKAGKFRALASFRRKRAEVAARRADHEGAGLRRRVLSVGRPVRARRARPTPIVTTLRERLRRPRSPTDSSGKAIANLGDRRRLPGPAGVREVLGDDAKRVEDAVQSIGKVEG